MTRVLAGDIGGTKTRLALYEASHGRLKLIAERTYPSREFGSLDDIVASFLSEAEARCDRACFGIAGPVIGRHATTTNLPWTIDADAMERRLPIGPAHLVNDLEATAWGIVDLVADDLMTLQEGTASAVGNRAVIAAGTGLGEAGLYWDGSRHQPFATEGGHASFAPGSRLEGELLDFLARGFDHVSWERVLSGPGLVNLYEFLLVHRGATNPSWLADAMAGGDPAAAVVEAARGGGTLCREAVELFVRLYGAEAGNLALKHMAVGGVYLAGGIAPKILDFLDRSTFLDAFLDKGRMRPLLEAMPVHVVLNDRAALGGAARAALEKEAT